MGDYISESGGEDGSPTITQEMIDEAASDQFNRYTLPNGRVLWYVTADKLGNIYADGIDNDGDGAIDEQIDIGIDDEEEAWVDGVDNDGDGTSGQGPTLSEDVLAVVFLMLATPLSL